MADKRNFAALEWVMGEIEETLKDARQALEAYVEDPKDATRIRFCITHIHQVHGSLQMVEFHGASLLAEEMEQLAQSLMDGGVTSEPEAQEVLMRALLQLPTYLERVKSQKEDHPGLVMPLLNDLRAVRNQSYLSETNLFSPNLQVIKEVYGERHPITNDKLKLQQVLKKLREMYQFAAASVLREIKIDENLNYLDKVFSRLEALTVGTAAYPTWEVSAALIEGLLRGDIELSVAVRGILRHLARELRVMGEKAPGALDFMPRESLLKNLLYYVARAEGGGKKINRVKQRYSLSQALLDGVSIGDDAENETLSTPDPEAIRSVVVALSDEINAIKHALDLALSGHGSPEDLKEVLPIVKRVADTLAVLGIGDLRKQVNYQAELLEDISQQNSFDQARLLDVASKIIDTEHRLEAIAKVVGTRQDLASVNEREIEIDQAKTTVLKECQHGLEQAKDAIVEYISSKWDKSHLLNVGDLLHNIRGGLDIIPLPRPAAILDSCSAYIQEQLIDKDVQPGWEALDTLADAIASLEYYLERLLSDMDDDTASLLDVAESSVCSLGYAPQVSPTPVVPDVVESPSVAPVQPAVEPEPEVQETQPLAQPLERSSVEIAPQPDEQPSPEPQPALPEPSVSLDKITIDDEAEESDIDDEIIEIFIEEAAEVKETLDEYVPQWKANMADQDALVVVRRAFHTLKGSGRMVEAFAIGELAWSVENMLNRVIDNTIKAEPAHAHIIDLVINLLPELIKAFSDRIANPQQALTEQYMAWAESMSQGNIPAELTAMPADGVPTPDLSVAVAQDSAQQNSEDAYESDEAVDEDEDQVLWDIFSSEAASHLVTIEAFIAQMDAEAPIYSPPSDEFQRALHTLKGSAKMAKVTDIASMAEPLEIFAKELIAYQVSINADILQLYRDVVTYTSEGLAQIAARQPVEIARVDQFVARTEELREMAVGHLIRLKELEKDGQKQVDPRLLAIFMAEEMNLLLDADLIIDGWRQNGTEVSQIDSLVDELTRLEAGAEQAKLPDMAALSAQVRTLHEQHKAGQQEANEDFFVILSSGHLALLDMVDAVAAGQNVLPPSEEVTSALASLIHSGSLLPEREFADQVIEETPTADVSYVTEVEFEAGEAIDVESELDVEDEIQVEDEVQIEPVLDVEESTHEIGIDVLPEQDSEAEAAVPADDEVELLGTASDSDSLGEIELQSFEDSFTDTQPTDYQSTDDPSVEEITFDVPPIEGVELEAEDEPLLADGSDDLEFSLVDQDDAATEVEDDFDLSSMELSDAQDDEQIAATDFSDELKDLSEGVEPQDTSFTEQPEFSNESEPEPDSSAGVDETQQRGVIPGLLDAIDTADEDYDEDILEVFLEEAEELTEELDEAIHTWEGDWGDVDSSEEIKRALHTLKGGARLSGMTNLGELTHNYESYLIGTKFTDVDDEFFEKIHDYQDRVLVGVKAIQQFMAGGDASAVADSSIELDDAAESAEGMDSAAQSKPQVSEDSTDSNVVPFAPKPRELEAPAQDGENFAAPALNTAAGGQATVRKASGPQEVIKVNAELLEELVNLAGETSISRARVEQQVSDFSQSLDDIDATIDRLQEQLRRLDIETEAQVIFRQEQLAADEEFDPLEMDRYSQLQQLSRSLIESASDLVDLRLTLTENIRDTETLLLQQSRINTTLQEGLMRSRMVPFARLVPRLRRIVRQVSGELGKNVSFELDNVEGELDRSVLERMVPPLEHMLRNAVDHGIESPEKRMDAGKPETGRIVLSLAREGGDVILTLADDGGGVDLRRVRDKAIERGLMTSDSDLSDFDIMQFILHAGFSTAEEITQISGRGVGMDVVSSEIKAMGGSVVVNSNWGKGTEIVVRLPFTVSVNRALMVEVGPDQYAIPLNTIEGIVRVSPFELEHYYTTEDARFEYAGENYQVRYLGTMLKADVKPKLDGHALPLPVLLVRSADRTMAIQVDNLMGSREVVVKSLGSQFSAVQGLSGATLMGDGSVIVILDPHALVRHEAASAAALELEATAAALGAPVEVIEDTTPTVMVVDDSVTVRKVTTRFLEREGFNVMTAKDGVDALRVLQDEIPDLMLLDIEMPRMDGFEVAKNIRTTSRWKHLPIIMITSRTGDKHRDRAMELGVNRYMGKPYQEEALLEGINELIAEQSKG